MLKGSKLHRILAVAAAIGARWHPAGLQHRFRLPGRHSRSKYMPHDNGPRSQRKATRERRQFERNRAAAARRHNDRNYTLLERMREEGR